MIATAKKSAAESKPKSTAKPESQPKLKRIIWGTGGKGGVGKSTAMRGFYDLLRKRNVNTAAFDGDRDNSQL
ncbi:MAG: hypothetical protein AAFY76_16595, partial [Cyanobacteria bacterium J06649_11]